MLHFASVCTPCWMLLDVIRVVAQSLKPVKLFSQQLPTCLLFRDRRSVAQQCWIRSHSSSNIVGATHAHYPWFTKTYGLYPSHDALQVPTLLVQQCWELLRPFARSLRVARVASSPGGDAICGMLVIALDLAPNGFSPGTPVLPLSLKFIQISVRSGNVDKEPFYWCVTRISYCWPSTSEARHVFRFTGADPHWFPAFSRNRSEK